MAEKLRPRAILFDLDGTLVDSDAAYAKALRAVGIQPKGDDFLAARARVKSRLGDGHPAARNRLLYFKALAEHRAGFDAAAVLERMLRYERALEAETRRQWKALGRDRLFKRLSRRFPCVIVTNENLRTQLLKLRAMDPKGAYFQRMFSSEESGVEKPHRKIFREALTELGLPPKDCLMVGDNWSADIEPALKMRMPAVWSGEFAAGSMPRGGAGVRRIRKLDELEDLLG